MIDKYCPEKFVTITKRKKFSLPFVILTKRKKDLKQKNNSP